VNPRQHEGFIYEAMFKVQALLRMFDVLEPSTIQPYDLMVECPRGLVKVQVKGTNLWNRGDSAKFKLSAHKKVPDYTARYDVLACYLQQHGFWYIIPSSVLKTRTVRFYPHPKKTISKWEQFRENWSPFYTPETNKNKKGET